MVKFKSCELLMSAAHFFWLDFSPVGIVLPVCQLVTTGLETCILASATHLQDSALDHNFHSVGRDSRELIYCLFEHSRWLIRVKLQVMGFCGMFHVDCKGNHCRDLSRSPREELELYHAGDGCRSR